jgi:hypothetical protein
MVEQSVVFCSTSAQYTCHGKNVPESFVKISHVNSAVPRNNTQHSRKISKDTFSVGHKWDTKPGFFFLYEAWFFFFLVLKCPAADVTGAPQPSGLCCYPVMKMISFFRFSK